jgi:L-asparaginase
MKIIFIQTGGTIDKDYPQGETNHGYEFQITDPAFTSILQRAKPDFEYEIVSALQKDSLDITDQDRVALFDLVSTIDGDKIVLTHGTDTIHITAEKLSTIEHKTIVITGAMLPEKFYTSDADFNVGMAVGAVQSLPHGVYVCLYGKVTSWKDFVNK